MTKTFCDFCGNDIWNDILSNINGSNSTSVHTTMRNTEGGVLTVSMSVSAGSSSDILICKECALEAIRKILKEEEELKGSD